MEKRPAEDVENGDGENGAKKAKLDPEGGRLLFCGSTNWEYVSRFYNIFLAASKNIEMKLKTDYLYQLISLLLPPEM